MAIRRAADRAGTTARWRLRLGAALVALFLLGGSALPAEEAVDRRFAQAVAGWGFDLVSWEVDALAAKIGAQVQQPASAVAPDVAPDVVRAYMDRARRIGEIEGELARRASAEGERSGSGALMAELEELRARQIEARGTVEQIVQRQVGAVVAEEGFTVGPWVTPPVQFAFTEPPKKLVVSARDRIETTYSQMLDAGIGLGTMEAAETAIAQQPNAVGYITNIGGLGAYPTMVVDQASLGWVLSTVAHEWAHNYLVFFPLGWNYFASQEMTTINETVAEIVGNEIGEQVLARFYPELVPQPSTTVERAPYPELLAPPPFDFQTEMRETRLEVDRLLGEGKVDEAEAYMEARRQEFVAQGYPLRVLNQAYFAFHGSYGTSAASTSPIGPKLERLRDLMPNLRTFLHTVRGFTSVNDLDAALAAWEAAR
jgi:hypothetical protein